MANPSLAVLRALDRTLVSDSDSSNYGVSDAEQLVLLNEAQQLYGAVYPEDVGYALDSGTITQGQQNTTITTDAQCRAVIRATRDTQLGQILERRTVTEILRKQIELPTQGVISEYAIQRVPDSMTVFEFFPWPIPAAASTNIFLITLKDIADLDANGSIWGSFAGYTIARIAAVSHAMILGRFDRAAQIEKMLPERVQLYMKIHKIALRPSESPEATVSG